MKINYLTLIDVQKGMHTEHKTAIIQCNNCKGQKIGNHIEWIKDHIKKPENHPLHRCSSCIAETKLKAEEVEKIKKILEIKK